MKLISSYPRSGQAKLRFLICNIFYPEIEHDFATIRKYTPSIDSAEQLNNCADNVKFIFTHSNIRSDIYLYRHIGDVLISEFWYKKKNYPEFNTTVNNWIKDTQYGLEWRRSIEAGRGASLRLSFENLNAPDVLASYLGVKVSQVEEALKKCTFEQMQKIERSTDIIGGDKSIDYMRNGTSEQWRELDFDTKYHLLQQNEGELYYLKYWSPENWKVFLNARQ